MTTKNNNRGKPQDFKENQKMKIENKKINDCRVKLTINAGADETKEDWDAVVKAFIKDAPIPGFRRGKAPLQVVKNRFGKEMQRDINSRLVSRFVHEAIEHEKLDMVHIVDIDGVVFTPETGISFVATIDVKPQFKLPKYQKLPVEIKEIAISEEAIDGEVSRIRKMNAKSEESESEAKEGDYLQVSFEATEGGKPVEGVPEASARYIKSDMFWLTAGEKPEYEAIPGSGKAMLGLKKGDDFTFDTKFPSDFSVEALRKIKVTYTGKVLGVRAMIEPTDEELLKNLHMEKIEDLRKVIADHMKEHEEAEERRRVSDEITQLLIKKASFEVPESDVAQAAQGFIDEIIEREVAGMENAKEYVESHVEELRKKAEEKAIDAVRLRYIADAIAAEQKIEVIESEIRQEIESAAAYMARRNSKNAPSAAKLYDQLVQSGRISLVEAQIRERKVIDWIIADIKASK